MEAIDRLIHEARPDWQEALLFVPLSVLIAFAASKLSAWLKTAKQWQTPYTRKVFHFIIFTSASLIHFVSGLYAVLIFGSITSIFVLLAVYRGDRSSFFHSLARPTDAPKQKLFILVPLFTTAIGGLLSNLFFGGFASIGYLVGGWGDAVGEPVGTRWGKHRYKVMSLAGVPATRSLEGSAAVFLLGSLVAGFGLAVMGASTQEAVLVGLLCGFGGALVEAISSHGLDNLTIQLAASGLAYCIMA